jgi:hypothetical protein
VLTSETNLIQLQKQLKGVAKQIFEFHSIRNGTRVIPKDMLDYQSVKAHFETSNLSYYTFYPKSQKPIKVMICHLLQNTPVENIPSGLVELGFDVISVKQLSIVHRSPEGTTSITLRLFLVILPRTAKSQYIFRLSNLCHISMKVESYKSQNALTQCFNCQKFGHVWANCKQLPHCLWCGGGHMHRDWPERDNTSLTPTCCNCQLAEGEAALPVNYRGCSHSKDEMRNKFQGK